MTILDWKRSHVHDVCMKAAQGASPGTVSKILWHFTGGPSWNEKLAKQNKRPKSAAAAYRNLQSILSSRELRLGSYNEIVKVVIPEQRVFNRKTGKVDVRKNVPAEIVSVPVCCLSDIPAAHLSYHANRYGRFAIGFHRSSVVAHGFNPVLYSLGHTGVVRSIYDGFSEIELADTRNIAIAVDGARSDADEAMDILDDFDITWQLDEVESEASSLDHTLSTARSALRALVAFVKTFGDDEFGTIYCEREWRATEAYKFSAASVAMVVIPRRIGKRAYFDDFVKKAAPRMKLPRSIPIVPWEDLVEH